jgi:4-hydroxy-4-methyl-2-oxoglutarate aldolase
MTTPLSSEQIEALRSLDACTLANAIETFHLRLRNEGFAKGAVRCLFPQLRPMVGYAATVCIRGASPPMRGSLPTADSRSIAANGYIERTDWWDYIQSVPTPRVIVVQDVSSEPGVGALLGEVHVNILRALGCAGAVTNGAVRDIPAVQGLGFPLFAGRLSVSHSYVHIVSVGAPVAIDGLKVKSGDLLHGDLHGVQSIPLEIASEIPAVAVQMVARERALIALCRSSDFSLEKLRSAVSDRRT